MYHTLACLSLLLLRPLNLLPRPAWILSVHLLSGIWCSQLRLHCGHEAAIRVASLGGLLGPGATIGVVLPLTTHPLLYLLSLVGMTALWIAHGPVTPLRILGCLLTGIVPACVVNRYVFVQRKREGRKAAEAKDELPSAAQGSPYKGTFAPRGGCSIKLMGNLHPEDLTIDHSSALLSAMRARLDAAGHRNVCVAFDVRSGCVLLRVSFWDCEPAEGLLGSGPSASDLSEFQLTEAEVLDVLSEELRALVLSSTRCQLPSEPATLVSVAGSSSLRLTLPLEESFATSPPRPRVWGPSSLDALPTEDEQVSADRRSVSFSVRLEGACTAPTLLTAALERADNSPAMTLRRFVALPSAAHDELMGEASADRLGVLDDLEGCLSLASNLDERSRVVDVLSHLEAWATEKRLKSFGKSLQALRGQLDCASLSPASPLADAMHPLWLTFTDPEQERRYQDQAYAADRGLVRRGAVQHVLSVIGAAMGNKYPLPLLILSTIAILVCLFFFLRSKRPAASSFRLCLLLFISRVIVTSDFSRFRFFTNPPPEEDAGRFCAVFIAVAIFHNSHSIYFYRTQTFAYAVVLCFIELAHWAQLHYLLLLGGPGQRLEKHMRVSYAMWPISGRIAGVLPLLVLAYIFVRERRRRRAFVQSEIVREAAEANKIKMA